MRRLARIFNIIMERLGIRRASRPEDIPKKLSPEALAQAMEEARFLYSRHAVDVRALMPGEIPDLPKPATGQESPQG
jgi:hypothetical protein